MRHYITAPNLSLDTKGGRARFYKAMVRWDTVVNGLAGLLLRSHLVRLCDLCLARWCSDDGPLPKWLTGGLNRVPGLRTET